MIQKIINWIKQIGGKKMEAETYIQDRDFKELYEIENIVGKVFGKGKRITLIVEKVE